MAVSYVPSQWDFSDLEPLLPLPDDFRCSICFSLMKEPQLTSCGHNYCKSCITAPVPEEQLREKAALGNARADEECPVCQERGFRILPNKMLEGKILELKVYCIKKDDGCEWEGQILSLEAHLAKQCSYVLVNCKLEPLGCKEKLLRKDMLAHVSDVLSHMALIKEQFVVPEQSFCHLFQEKDIKMEQLIQRVDSVETKIVSELKNKSNVKWTPISTHKLLSVVAGVKCCSIPEHLVPLQAKEVLLLLAVHSCSTTPKGFTHCLRVFVEEKGVRYAKYMHVTTFKQPNAWNNNTENLWLPMPTNRMLHIEVPKVSGNFSCNVLLTGYR